MHNFNTKEKQIREEKDKKRTEGKVNTSFAEVKETNVNREYDIIEDNYQNMSSMPTRTHEKDISFTQNQAYASIKHS